MNIAFADADRAIRVVDVWDQSESRLLSVPGLRCSWPVVSPNGELVAFSGSVGGGNGTGRLGFYVAAIRGGGPGLVYANEPGSGGIARGTPHYACWSPDGSKVAFIAQTGAGLSLFCWDSTDDAGAVRLLDGGPMYFAWSPLSDEIFVHSFTGHYMIGTSGGAEPRQYPGLSTLYMSPSWDHSQYRVAFFLDGDHNRQRLVAINQYEAEVKVLSEFSGIGAAAWRPGFSQLAVARSMIGSSGFYSGLSLVDYETRDANPITQDPVLAFFWSPCGSQMAYVTSSEDAEGSLRIAVQQIDTTSDPVYLSDFRPSPEQLIHFMFFDQYSKSMPIWSSASDHLLVFGELGYHVERTPLGTGGSNQALIFGTSGEEMPATLPSGSIGSWVTS